MLLFPRSLTDQSFENGDEAHFLRFIGIRFTLGRHLTKALLNFSKCVLLSVDIAGLDSSRTSALHLTHQRSFNWRKFFRK